MNRYNLRRWLGAMSGPPEEAYTGDPDVVLERLKEEYASDRRNGAALERLISFAFSFSRLDSLTDTLGSDDWLDSPEAMLARGRLRFYQAMAENPVEPKTSSLESAAADFHGACEGESTAFEALACLVRIHAVLEDSTSALRRLRKLERGMTGAAKDAAAGARLFLAERPGTASMVRRRHLAKAKRLLRRSGSSEQLRLLLVDIDGRLGQSDSSAKRLVELEREGSAEAQYEILDRECARAEMLSDEERQALAQNLESYRSRRPADSRYYILKGNLIGVGDPEAARMAWRAALIMDDRQAEAWGRLGDLYRASWEIDSGEHKDAWMEAAVDSYIKAAGLSPLESRFRISLGMMEREASRPGRAVSTLKGALALQPDNEEARRWLAASWSDLAYSAELDESARKAAADRSRKEWMTLLQQGKRDVIDLLGYCRAAAQTGPEALRSDLRLVKSMLDELILGINDSSVEDLIDLAEDFLRAETPDMARPLLDRAAEVLPNHSRILLMQAAMLRFEQPAEGIRLFLEAAKVSLKGSSEWIDSMIGAAETSLSAGRPEGAEAILKAALKETPGRKDLSAFLADVLFSTGRNEEAADIYSGAVRHNPADWDLLEDTVWFLRSIQQPQAALDLLEEASAAHPSNGRILNQLGIHFMESGWDEETGAMTPDSLKRAVDSYRKAVNAEPDSAVYKGNLGDALRQAGQWTEAAELLEAALEEGRSVGESAFAKNSLARLEDERSYAAEGSESSAEDWESSGDLYRSAADEAPDNPDFQRDYAWWLYRERRLEDAVERYRKAFAAAPQDATLPYGEATCWKELGDEAKAMDALEQAIAIVPGDPVMLADKADLIGEMGNTRKADDLYREIISVTAAAAWAWERYASFLERHAHTALDAAAFPVVDLYGGVTGFFSPYAYRTAESDALFNNALSAWRKAAEASPEDKRIKGRIGTMLAAMGQKSEALSVLESSLVHDATDSELLTLIGCLEADSIPSDAGAEAWAGVLRRFEKAVEKAPMIASNHGRFGCALVCSGNPEKAAKAFREAVTRETDVPAYAVNAGIASLLSGDYEDAIHYLLRALVAQDEASWQNALGLAHLAAGSADAAVEAFRSACLDEPENEVFVANLALAHETLHLPEGPIQ